MRFVLPSMLLLVLLFNGFNTMGQSRNRLPNIIYIYADDMGYGELGCYGQQKIRTPNLDRMAREGIRFTQHYTSAPVCAPARGMLMTGKHGGHAQIRGNYEMGGFEDSTEGGQMPLAEGAYTIAKMMQQAGYATALIGKWGLGMHNTSGSPNKQGFDYAYGYLDQKQAHNFYPTHFWENGRWDSLNNPPFYVHQPLPANETDPAAFNRYKGKTYSITRFAEKTLHYIRQHKDQPFFLYLPYTAPHVSLQAPDEAVQEYLGQFEETPYRGERGYASTLYPRSTYAAMITYMDKQIGRIMALLQELGIQQNTLIMFSSDNGASANEGGADTEFFNSTGVLRGRKRSLYEGGIREPFIARWPARIAAGNTTDHVSAQFDLMATLAEITGTKLSSTDGISFLPVLTGRSAKQQVHPYLYFEFGEAGGLVAIRMGKWKGVKSGMKANKDTPWELYNLEADISETRNVAAQHPELIQQFESIVKKEHEQACLREWEFVSPKFKSEAPLK